MIMPVYRGEHYVVAAIESVLAQTYRTLEFVIINDRSTDRSAAVIAPFLSEPRIRYTERRNDGVAAARNTDLSHATGAYIALLDQDDLWSCLQTGAPGKVFECAHRYRLRSLARRVHR